MNIRSYILALGAILLVGCIEEEKTRPYDEFADDYEAIQAGTFTGFGFDGGKPEPDASASPPDMDTDMGLVVVPDMAAAQCSVAGDPANVTFVNATGQAATLTWIDYQCAPVAYGELAADASAEQGTFVGHVWQLVAGQTVLAERVVTANGETLTFE